MIVKEQFKIGDVVTLVNRTPWSKVLNRDGQRVQQLLCGRLKTFKILAIDCRIPIDNHYANTLIQAEDIDPGELSQEIITINDCNLRHSIMGIGIQYIAAGKNVTSKLSKQSKTAIFLAHLKGE